MQLEMSGHRTLAILGSLAVLFAIAGKAEGGIKVANPKVTQIGDPTIEYSVSVYLTPGSTLYASLQPVIALNLLAGVGPIPIVSGSGLYGTWFNWLALIGPSHNENVTITEPNGTQTFNVIATSVAFDYLGSKITNNTTQEELLGTFVITQPFSSLPLLPGGSEIPISYSIQGVPQSTPLEFSVVPEPSSLVVVGLVGLSVSGYALLRRRRRAA